VLRPARLLGKQTARDEIKDHWSASASSENDNTQI
jgi:hypothetical protein